MVNGKVIYHYKYKNENNHFHSCVGHDLAS